MQSDMTFTVNTDMITVIQQIMSNRLNKCFTYNVLNMDGIDQISKIILVLYTGNVAMTIYLHLVVAMTT